MSNLGTITYTIDVRTGNLVSATRDADRGLNDVRDSMNRTDQTARTLGGGLSRLATAVAGVITYQALKSAQQLAESYNVLRAQIARLSENTNQAAATYQKLVDVASDTGATLKVTVSLWQGLTGSLKEAGATNPEILRLVETIQKIGSVGGSSAEEMSNALRQFGQSMAGGIVRGEEFNSVIENMPELARQMAKGLGIPFSELRKQMLDGQLTAEKVQKALVKQQDEVDAAFAAMPRTVHNAANAITTEFGTALADLDKFYGVSTGVAKGFDAIADAMKGVNTDDIVSGLEKAAVVAEMFAAVLIGRASIAAYAYVKAQYASVTATLARMSADNAAIAGNLRRAQAETVSATAALRVAQAEFRAAEGTGAHTFALTALNAAQDRYAASALATAAAQNAANNAATLGTKAFGALRTVMSFLGGPLGVVLLAAAAIYAFATSTDSAKGSVDALNGSLKELTFAQLQNAANNINADLKSVENRMSSLKTAQKGLFKRPFENDKSFEKRKTEVQALIDTEEQEAALRKKRLSEISAQQEQLAKSSKDQEPLKKLTQDELDGQKIIAGLKQQEALAKKVGVERAKLAALQKLGEGASPEQREEAQRLAASIYQLEEAQKNQKASDKKGISENEAIKKKAAAEEKKGIEDNIKVYQDLGAQFSRVGKNAKELAMDQAQLSLNKYATPEQVEQVRAMAAALYDLNQVKENKALLGRVDPSAGASQALEKQLKDLDTLKQAKILSDTDYLTFKEQAETEYNARMTEIEMQRFAAQSAGNEAMIAGFDALASSGTQALSGLLSGTSSLQDAMGGVANTVLNAVIGSFVQAGVEWVKQQIFMQGATQATKAAEIGGIAAVTAAQTAATGTIAATTTATAATTGATVATAMAPAAGMSSIASFGGAAVIGGAALLATMALAKSAGGRQYGGGVQAGSMYRVNETGAPEIFNAANGRQYMMPNSRGEVVSNKDATSGSGGGGSAIVNIHNYTGAQVSQSQSTVDRQQVIDIVIGDMMQDGKIARATNQITGTRRQGV